MDRLYVRRDESGGGLRSILDTAKYEELSMIEYIQNKDSEIMTTIQHYTGNRLKKISRESGRNKMRDVRRDGRQR